MTYYAGIGSRETPLEVMEAFVYLGAELAKRGYILRSGAADGADKAFEQGCDMENGKKEIYLPWKEFNKHPSNLYKFEYCKEAFEIAQKYHPNFDICSRGGKALIVRDGFQVLGGDLNTPSSFIICYTKGGNGGGGTGQAIRIAKDYGIKVCDFGRFPKEQAMTVAKQVLGAIDKGLFVQKEPSDEKQSDEREITEHE